MKLQKRLGFQLAFRYALLILVAFALVFASFYAIMSSAMVRERSNVLNQRLDIIVDGLNTRLNSVMALQSEMLNNDTLQNSLKRPGVSYSPSAQLNRYRANSYLFNAIYLFDAKYNTLAISRPITGTGGIASALHDSVEAFAKSLAFRQFVALPDGTIYFLFALYPPENYMYSYYGAVEVNRDRLFFDFSKALLGVFASASISDGGQVVAQIGPDITSDTASGGHARHVSSRHFAFEKTCSAYASWKVTALYDQGALRAASVTQVTALCAIFLLTVILALLVSLVMARGIVQPVKQVLDSMKRLEQGEYPPPLPVRRDDEIGQLVSGYNHAVQRLADLNQDILAEQQEKRRYEVLSIQTQLDLLQSQINPHFIHNTLNTLNFMALRDGNRELSEVIVSFNALLRASLSNAVDFGTVAEEVEYVRQYMRIQRHRYADRTIDCRFDIEDDAMEALLPRLILQPLVENSLFHGLLPSTNSPGVIEIRCRTVGDQISVSISDNGVGMSEARMREISGSVEYPSHNSFNRIGLRNVRERLNLLYKTECSFDISSEEGSGTTISFTVPHRR